MLSSITRGSSPFALPYITPTPTVRYDFTLGYGGNAASAIDTSGNSNNGTATNFNIGTNWLPNEKSGVVKIPNTSASNMHILGPNIAHNNIYSVSMGFMVESVVVNSTNEIAGAGVSTNDTEKWCLAFYTSGTNYAIQYFRATSGSSATYYTNFGLALNTWYIVGITNDTTSTALDPYGSSIFKVWKPASSVENVAINYGYAAGAAGRIKVGKAGVQVFNYGAGMRLGHFMWWNGTALTNTQHEAVASAYKAKYGLL